MQVDQHSPTWRSIRAYVAERLRILCVELEKPLDPTATAAVRGQIKELRLMLSQVETPATGATTEPVVTGSIY